MVHPLLDPPNAVNRADMTIPVETGEVGRLLQRRLPFKVRQARGCAARSVAFRRECEARIGNGFGLNCMLGKGCLLKDNRSLNWGHVLAIVSPLLLDFSCLRQVCHYIRYAVSSGLQGITPYKACHRRRRLSWKYSYTELKPVL